MGACFSSEEQPPRAAAPPIITPAPPGVRGAEPGAPLRRSNSSSVRKSMQLPPPHTSPSSFTDHQQQQQAASHRRHMDAIARLHALHMELASLSACPLLALPDAADVLAAHAGADLVGVYAFPDGADRAGGATPPSPCAVLLAAHGRGAALLERRVVVRDVRCSPALLRDEGGAGAGDGRIIVLDAAAPGAAAAALPLDFAELHAAAGLRSLAAIAVGCPGAGHAPLGAVVLGSARPGAFDAAWAAVWASAAATGLLQHMRQAQVALAAAVLRDVDAQPDPVAAIGALLEGAGACVAHATNIRMGVRLALLEDDGRSAMLFEGTRSDGNGNGDSKATSPTAAARSAALPLAAGAADVAVRELPLANTLLASAVAGLKARFVRDAAAYLQNSRAPARDVFTHATRPVVSVVVVPLVAGGRAFGGLYFTQSAPW